MSGFKDFFSRLFGGGNNSDAPIADATSALDVDTVIRGIDEVFKQQPCMRLTPRRAENLSVFDSKLGGVPYMPKGFQYPIGVSGMYEGLPLRLLAQLNFAKLPAIEGFPAKGILQFFCSSDTESSFYGLDLEAEDRSFANGFRVIYHKDVIEDPSLLMSASDMPEFPSEQDFPIDGEIALDASKPCDERISFVDFRFESLVLEVVNKLCKSKIEDIYSINNSLFDALKEKLVARGTKVGGFPFFTQEDPRRREEDSDYDVTLLQIDSANDAYGKSLVMWGDNGVGNFFIRKSDLARLDFSHVVYNWDCY